MGRLMLGNKATIIGFIENEPEYDHTVYEEKFYKTYISAKRNSGVEDVIPAIISEKIFDKGKEWKGKFVEINGSFRSKNILNGDKKSLLLFLFADDMFESESEYAQNEVYFDAHICRKNPWRKTPLGREIIDFIVAVSRGYGRTDYIPCIAWGRNARYVNSMNVGDHVFIDGRIQSRRYKKTISEDRQEYEIRTAYEVSVNRIKV